MKKIWQVWTEKEGEEDVILFSASVRCGDSVSLWRNGFTKN